MIGLLSNENRARGVNWTLLSDSLYREIEALTPSLRIAPPAAGWGNTKAIFRAMAAARKASVLFQMNGKTLPDKMDQLCATAGFGAVRCVFYVDPWKHCIDRIRKADALLGHDIVFIPFREAYDELSSGKGGERYHYLPYAADTRLFGNQGRERDIDILWMGRRDEALHQAILAHCDASGLCYMFRERTGFVDDPREMAALVARSKYFVATPPDVSRSGGFSPLVMRYMEGIAAGCRLIGRLPASGEFEALLPRDAMLEVAGDGSDFAHLFEADQGSVAGWEATKQAEELVHAKHGWDTRAQEIIDTITEYQAAASRPSRATSN